MFDAEGEAKRELAKAREVYRRDLVDPDADRVAPLSLAALAGEELVTGALFTARRKANIGTSRARCRAGASTWPGPQTLPDCRSTSATCAR
jgi:hypothetical protein